MGFIDKILPTGSAVIIVCASIVYGVYLFIKFNAEIIRAAFNIMNKAVEFLYKIIGKHVKTANKKLVRRASLNKNSTSNKVYTFFYNIIIDMDLAKDGVSVAGMITFLGIISFIGALILNLMLDLGGLSLIAFATIFILFIILFKYFSVTRVERREELVMDAVDLLVSDVKGGIFNSIIRYLENIHPDIRVYFSECIDNIQNKGYSFTDAMMLLNSRLGRTFDDFCNKAILYESKADDTMDDIFSSIIEKNRVTRILRETNKKTFKTLQVEFLVCCGIILGYAVFSIFYSPFTREFLLSTTFGQILLFVDALIIAGVLAYITMLKTSEL